jgi:hypothetical protein
VARRVNVVSSPTSALVCPRSKSHSLAASLPKQLYTSLPLLHLAPHANRVPPAENVYLCPVYKTLTRQVRHWGRELGLERGVEAPDVRLSR